ncbi:hypothetical protein F0336_14145 [Serratia liquefaciens]|uniref:hypothetical protein n=1 Tax=Serratia liquefaciens TaxID=614 RepID=UPI0011F3624B|nr:hypothetical protein [Serratia liquefaciens]QIC87519.1 hypothetical protein F0336_14145 [Serratia liquefaciens]
MTPEQFTYWLQGFVELHGDLPTDDQWKSIKEHLQTVFVKVTPPVLGGPGSYFNDWLDRPAMAVKC